MTDKQHTEKKSYRRVLTIAGSDSGGGAGIQADLKTFSALGCYGMSVITALTAQNTLGVTGIHAAPTEFVREQMEAVLTDIGTDAVKIGMLFSPELIETVATCLAAHDVKNIVLDPVMVATSGDRLLQPDAIAAIREHLLPVADLITPNIPEAAVLLDRKIKSGADLSAAAEDLAGMGCRNILIKGGHLEGEESDDLLYLSSEKRMVSLPAARIETPNTHGTGCTLSSAIAAFIAKGNDVENATGAAKAYIHGAILAGKDYAIGGGHGPVHHFYNLWS